MLRNIFKFTPLSCNRIRASYPRFKAAIHILPLKQFPKWKQHSFDVLRHKKFILPLKPYKPVNLIPAINFSWIKYNTQRNGMTLSHQKMKLNVFQVNPKFQQVRLFSSQEPQQDDIEKEVHKYFLIGLACAISWLIFCSPGDELLSPFVFFFWPVVLFVCLCFKIEDIKEKNKSNK